MACGNVHGDTVTSEFYSVSNASQHSAHEASFKYLFNIVNQISDTTHTFPEMLPNFYLVTVYIHGV